MRNIVVLCLILLGFSSCVSHTILSLEQDDAYYTPKDRMTQEEMDKHLAKQAKLEAEEE